MRARGYLRDAPHKRRQKDARRLLALSPTFPPAASLERFEGLIMNQGPTGSCTGHGTSQGLVVAFAAMGSPLAFTPSPLLAYQVARALERSALASAQSLAHLPPLEDVGAMPADVMAGITHWGIAPMGPLPADGRFSDVTAANVNSEPRLLELEAAAEVLVVGEYRIDEAAADVCDQVCQAIASGIPVGIGAFVDSAFEAWTPGAPLPGAPNLADPNGGGHWFLITSYATQPDGSRLFRGPNSWGPTWGDRGHWEASEAFVRAAWDLYCLTVRKVAAP